MFIVHPITAWILRPGRFERKKSIMYAIAFLAALAAIKTGELNKGRQIRQQFSTKGVAIDDAKIRKETIEDTSWRHGQNYLHRRQVHCNGFSKSTWILPIGYYYIPENCCSCQNGCVFVLETFHVACDFVEFVPIASVNQSF